MKINWQLIIFGSIHALILLLLFNSGLYHNSTLTGDVKLFFDYSSKIVHGLLPYRDFTIEYPPLSLVFFTLPRLAAATLDGYRYAFAVEVLVFDLFALYLLFNLSRILNIKPIVTLIVYTVLLLGIGPLLIYRYDLIPAVMVLASLYAFSRKRYGLSWAMLAVGVMTKIYPAVIAPIFLIYEFSQHRYKEAIREVALCALVTEIIIAPFFFVSASGFVNSFSLQMYRGLQLESTYSSFVLLLKNLGLTEVYIKTTLLPLATSNIISSAATVLDQIAPVVMIAVLLYIYWLFYRRYRCKIQAKNQPDMENIIYYSFLVILIFVLTNDVFSPQYLIWFFPLAPLIIRRNKYILWSILILVSILTYYEFPLHYNQLQAGEPKVIYVLLVRNILLIAITGWLIEWRRPVAVQS
ncbi:MAG: glycosyltransferase 87 family protein [Dehalococcoidales bacterium]